MPSSSRSRRSSSRRVTSNPSEQAEQIEAVEEEEEEEEVVAGEHDLEPETEQIQKDLTNVSRRTQDRKQLIDYFMSKPGRFITNTAEYDAVVNRMPSRLDAFRSIYLGLDHPFGFIFSHYEMALKFGRHVAYCLGFDLRIKTSSYCAENGVTYKYVCCHREGGGRRVNASGRPSRKISTRTGCQWMAKLIGVYLDDQPPPLTSPSLYPTASNPASVVWYWEESKSELDHNHVLQDRQRPSPPIHVIQRPVPLEPAIHANVERVRPDLQVEWSWVYMHRDKKHLSN